MDIQIDKNSRLPINEQLKEQLKGLIHTGRVKTGEQLPTIRELSAALSVNINTIALAYRDLTHAGFIIPVRGKGTFVANALREEELQVVRLEILTGKIDALLRETDHLGYSRDEVSQVFVDHVMKKQR